ncbi:uncharacterized protein B0T23DRAFT_424922 [Neurospora hispaniola]|uniref:Uncharacterized protein n=1 Tax=Neurospora hispaniola TaxID=588809 RepID=A0AAJ0IFT9_9PEZI|nr:hypothetical protein B0T23DRAFT_424922 [Neurospora hispaniola]
MRKRLHECHLRWNLCSFSIRAQAQVARKALGTEWPGLHIRWGIDPMFLPIYMVPDVEITVRLSLPEGEPRMSTVTAHVGGHESVGDLIMFESDSEPAENIYDA